MAATAETVATSSTSAPTGTEIVFVDMRVAGYQAIVDAVAPGAQVVLIDSSQDGVHQMAQALEGRSDISAIHVVSHGADGVLLVGSGPLHAGNIAEHAQDLATIGAALTPDGDIQLWGCDIAAGGKGQAFLAALAQATGADIAASSNDTGGAPGADWTLEITTGDVAASHALDTAALAHFDGSLATLTASTLAELKAALTTAATNSVADTITLTADIAATGTGDTAVGSDGAATLLKINITDGQTLQIVGGGHVIDANYYGRVVEVQAGTVTMSNLTLREGLISADGGGRGVAGANAFGAGLRNAGTLTLSGVTVTANGASGGGGAGASNIYNSGGGGGGGGLGGHGGGSSGDGGAGSTIYPGAAGGAGVGATGGDWKPSSDTVGGRGGGSTGGAGGSYQNYSTGGAGGTANNGSISIGGGGGGGAYEGNGSLGGSAVGGVYNTGTLTLLSSIISGNVGAGGGGGGGGYILQPGSGANGGRGVGGIWSTAGSTLNLDAATNSALASNVGAGGGGGSGESGNGAAGGSNPHIYNLGTQNTVSGPTATINSAPDVTSAGGTTYTVRITYTDDGTVASSAIGTDDIKLGGQAATGFSIVSGANTATTVVDYTFAAPGGSFDRGDNGALSITAGDGPVTDNGGIPVISLTAGAADASVTINIPNTSPAGSVTISGTPTQGQTLTAGNSLTDADGMGPVSYQWKAAGTNIAGATSSTYVLTEAEVGKAITVVASYTDGHSTAESVSSSATATVANLNDAPTGTVTISGTATQGQTLTAGNSLADADGMGVVSYQWKADGTDIAGATSGSYVLTEAEVGKAITVVASYTDGHSTAESVSSSATATVANLNDAPTGTVTISGTATQGQTLTAGNSLADADGMGVVSYQWKADGTDIAGATSGSYVLTEAEVGKAITVVASYTDGHSTAESVSSSATATVANLNDAPTGTVTISGTATQGQTLTAGNSLADADGMGSVSYQWKADGTDIAGATSGSYVLTEAEVGKAITVAASYTDGHGAAESVSSSATATVANLNDAPTGSVTISGTVAQGQTLTAGNSLADADGMGVVSYQWKADGTDIAGATNGSYVLTEAEVDKAITVVASYTDGHGAAESVSSSATVAVANLNDAPTGSVTISGTAKEGQTLTAGNTLADPDGLGPITYQWKADGTSLAGATNATYVLTASEIGKTITVVASYTDGHGAAESVSSSATSIVTVANNAPTGSVTILGTATQGQTLTAGNSLADTDGLGPISYQWKAGGTDIAGATSGSYVLTEAEVGKVITVIASYTDGLGAAESVSSSATANVANVNDAPTGSVTIAGTATQGQTLTAANTLADPDGLGAITYQWKAGGTNIAGATSSTYALTEAEVGKAITVVASYTDGHSTAESVSSSATAAVANVNDDPTGSVTISGAATQGQTLTAANTLADPDGLGAITYQWKADGTSIAGATSANLVLGQAQVGKVITVMASYTDGHGTAETATSTGTTAIANVNDAPTGAVTISGSIFTGSTLTASHNLADPDGLGAIAYQWKAGGTDIAGATGPTYVLTSAELGKTITVVASYTDGLGSAESVTSAATSVVDVEPPSQPPPVTTTVDGLQIETSTVTNSDGTISSQVTIPVVSSGRTEQNGNPSAADIPITPSGAKGAIVQVPLGVGMTISGPTESHTAGQSLTDLIREIKAHTSTGSPDQLGLTGAGGDWLSGLAPTTPIVVRSITPTVTTTQGGDINLIGSTNQVEAFVIDLSHTPSTTHVTLNNVEYAVIVGAATVTGGDGANVVFGDSASQYIVLGADDDILHGGGGDDTVGSKGGNDRLYGDAGDDTLFGGEGDDLLDGGAGNDTVLMGGDLKDYVFTHNGSGLLATSFEGDDTIINVETLKMADGSTVTDLNQLVAGTTSVATMTYAFFTGKTPTAVGLEYLLHAPDTVNANDLGDPYYQTFNTVNRYINFAINLASPQGEAHAWFEANYGDLDYEQTLIKAYQEIFGVALTDDKIQHLLYDQVGDDMTRLHFFELFAGTPEGAKAGIVGWLLSAAVLENTGRYAEANAAFLNDFADGDAQLNVDLVGVYGDGLAWGTLG